MYKGIKRSLFSLYMAYFADYLTWGVAIAFLAVYITTHTTPFANLYWTPEVALGMAYAAFPIGEIIGSPILGDLSDWIGRKKVLIWGFWGSIFCMLLCAYTLWVGNFALFLVSQLLVGFFSGKQAMAQAAIVESDVGSKAQKLAFLSVIGGVSWVLGPFLGGLVMTQWFLAYGGYVWPSLLAALIYLLSLLLTQWFFVDTYKPSNPHLSATKFLRSMGDVFALTYREKLFGIFLINLLGWYLLIVALSNFLIERFHVNDAQVGFYNSYLSFCFTLGGVIGTAWLLRKYRAKTILFWSLLVGSVGLFLFYDADQLVDIWTYLAIPAITEAWIYPAYQTVLSDHTSEQNQGKIFGLVGATNGVCQFIASLILTGITSTKCILVAALLFLCSAALLPFFMRKKKAA